MECGVGKEQSNAAASIPWGTQENPEQYQLGQKKKKKLETKWKTNKLTSPHLFLCKFVVFSLLPFFFFKGREG